MLLRGAGACTATLSIDIGGVSVKLAFDNTSSVFGTALRHVAELGDAHGGLMGGTGDRRRALRRRRAADGAHALLAERCGGGDGGDARPCRWTSYRSAPRRRQPGDPLYAWLRHRAAPWVRAVLVEPMRRASKRWYKTTPERSLYFACTPLPSPGERKPLVSTNARCDARYPDASNRCIGALNILRRRRRTALSSPSTRTGGSSHARRGGRWPRLALDLETRRVRGRRPRRRRLATDCDLVARFPLTSPFPT